MSNRRMTLEGKQSYLWGYVSCDGQNGWVYADSLTVYPPAQH